MNKASVLKGLGLAIGSFALSSVFCGGDSLAPRDMIAPVAKLPSISGELLAQGNYVCSESDLIVDLVDGLTPEQVRTWQKKYGLNLKYNSLYARDNSLLLATVPSQNLSKIIKRLSEDEWVESAEPNFIMSLSQEEMEVAKSASKDKSQKVATSYPNDPLFKYQWHMNMINAPFAWKFSQGRGAVVAVIDTGVAWKDSDGYVACEDLAQTKIVPGYDFIHRNTLALDDNAHGTHVAGTIAQSTNNGLGVCGVAPQAAIMPIKVLSGAGSGRVSDIVDGIRFAADHGANVINMSLGGPLPSLSMARAVAYAHSKGTLVVCAAGNEHRNSVGYPAGYKDSYVVSALDAKGNLAWYSNHGKRVDISAPGGDTRTDDNGDGVVDGVYQNTIKMRNPSEQGYFAFQGTSMATPHVAGAAAVLVGQGVTSPNALKSILSGTAKGKGWDSKSKGYGAGALNVGKAAFKVGFVYGLARFVLAMLLALGLGAFAKKRGCGEKALIASGTIAASSGLFFLPLFSNAENWLSWLAMPLPAWDVFFWGASAHGNLLMCSCLIPLVLSNFAVRCSKARSVLAGLTLGWAVYLLGEIVTGTTALHFIPGCLDWLWWLLNGLFCICLAQVLLSELADSMSSR